MELVDKEYQVFVYQGQPCKLTKPPFRYIVYPDGGYAPLFRTPAIEDCEIDESGMLLPASAEDSTDMMGWLFSEEQYELMDEPMADPPDANEDGGPYSLEDLGPPPFGDINNTIPPWDDELDSELADLQPTADEIRKQTRDFLAAANVEAQTPITAGTVFSTDGPLPDQHHDESAPS